MALAMWVAPIDPRNLAALVVLAALAVLAVLAALARRACRHPRESLATGESAGSEASADPLALVRWADLVEWDRLAVLEGLVG